MLALPHSEGQVIKHNSNRGQQSMMTSALRLEDPAADDSESAEARLARITAASRVFLHTVQNLLGVPTILVGALDAEPLSDDTRSLAADAQTALDQIIVEARSLQVIVWDLSARPGAPAGGQSRTPLQ
jgi:hypothetical protein